MKAALLGVWNVYQEHKDHGVGGSVRSVIIGLHT